MKASKQANKQVKKEGRKEGRNEEEVIKVKSYSTEGRTLLIPL